MLLKLAILPFVVLILLGCKQQVKQDGMEANTNTVIVSSQVAPGLLNDWADAINAQDLTLIEKQYSPDAYSIVAGGKTITTSEQIAIYYRSQDYRITSIESLFSIEANTNRGVHYDLIKVKTNTDIVNTQLVIWRLEKAKIIREFEFTASNSTEANTFDTAEIFERRKHWIELCNAHNAENLVKELYALNTIYFNHKPLVIGTEAVIKEYGYMNSKDYGLHLEPITLEVINAQTVIEIGQCSGSYEGNYILIWRKQKDGTWKVYIDSNI